MSDERSEAEPSGTRSGTQRKSRETQYGLKRPRRVALGPGSLLMSLPALPFTVIVSTLPSPALEGSAPARSTTTRPCDSSVPLASFTTMSAKGPKQDRLGVIEVYIKVATSRKRLTRAPFAEMSMSRDVGAVRCGPTMTLSSWRCRIRTGSRSIEPRSGSYGGNRWMASNGRWTAT